MRVLVNTIVNVVSFLVLLFLVVLTLASASYLINFNLIDDRYHEPIFVRRFGYSFLDAILKQYLIGLGDFSTDDYQSTSWDDAFVWFFFLTGTLLTQITFLNMLIAMMGLTFDTTINNTHEGLKE